MWIAVRPCAIAAAGGLETSPGIASATDVMSDGAAVVSDAKFSQTRLITVKQRGA